MRTQMGCFDFNMHRVYAGSFFPSLSSLPETGILGKAMIRVRMTQYQSEDQIERPRIADNSFRLILADQRPGVCGEAVLESRKITMSGTGQGERKSPRA